MANTTGSAYNLTVITPVVPGHEQQLEDDLNAIPRGPDGIDSPFRNLPTTHFARLVRIPQLVDEGPPQRPVVLRSQYLLYCSVFTGALTDHLEHLRILLQPTTDRIWGHCVGYPTAADPGRFAAWFKHNQIRTSYFFAACPDADVARVRAALALRERVIAFAVRGQQLPDAELLTEFHKEFLAAGLRV